MNATFETQKEAAATAKAPPKRRPIWSYDMSDQEESSMMWQELGLAVIDDYDAQTLSLN
ncbi:MAG TPA: hypothetical protein VFE51_29705 [Verrucomicrobiae bacterium]|nr:hypothetical protein [Verrucomicrobiae bacterium]